MKSINNSIERLTETTLVIENIHFLDIIKNSVQFPASFLSFAQQNKSYLEKTLDLDENSLSNDEQDIREILEENDSKGIIIEVSMPTPFNFYTDEKGEIIGYSNNFDKMQNAYFFGLSFNESVLEAIKWHDGLVKKQLIKSN